jgi:hypothetical protein
MPVIDIGKRSEEAGLDAGLIPLEIGEQLFDPGPLHLLITAGRTGAAGDGKSCCGSKTDDVVFRHIDEGPDYHVCPVVGMEKRRHGFYLSVKKLVQKQCLDKIIPVVTKRYFRATQLPCLRIENAAPEP